MYLGTIRARVPKFAGKRRNSFAGRGPLQGAAYRPLNLSGVECRLGVVPVLPAAQGLLSIGSQIFGKKKEKEAINKAWRGSAKEALDAYLPIMGQVPGRTIGVTNMQLIWEGAMTAGVWGGPGKDVWVKDAIHGYAKCGDCLNILVPRAIAAGVDNPIRIVDEYAVPEWKKQGDHWALPRGATQRQILIDTIDALVARHKPDAPLYYAAAAPITSAPKSVPSAPVSAPAAFVPAISAPISVPILPSTATGDQVTMAIEQLTSQFLSTAQAQNLSTADQIRSATNFALDQLRTQGFNTGSSAVQEATQEIVKKKVTGLPPWAIPVGIGALILGGFALMQKRGRR